MNEHKEMRKALERYDRAVSTYWKDTKNAPNHEEMAWLRQLLDKTETQSTELERLKAWAATVVNNYHHVLTYDLTQEGIAMLKEGEEKHV